MTGQGRPERGNGLDRLDRRLLDAYQRDFPIRPEPFGAIAEDLGVGEGEVRERFARLAEDGYVSRIGAVVRPHKLGWSTLAAMAVPEARLEAVAELVSAHPEVNHNYEREHRFNLWFVVTADDQAAVAAVLDEIARQSGLPVMDLPMVEAYCLDLGFPLDWGEG